MTLTITNMEILRTTVWLNVIDAGYLPRDMVGYPSVGEPCLGV